MTGVITAIHPMKWGNGTEFVRATFKMEDHTWAKTDLCPSYRNYERWRKLLKVGYKLGDLKMRDKKTVDADSFPRFLGIVKDEPNEPPQMDLGL